MINFEIFEKYLPQIVNSLNKNKKKKEISDQFTKYLTRNCSVIYWSDKLQDPKIYHLINVKLKLLC